MKATGIVRRIDDLGRVVIRTNRLLLQPPTLTQTVLPSPIGRRMQM